MCECHSSGGSGGASGELSSHAYASATANPHTSTIPMHTNSKPEVILPPSFSMDVVAGSRKDGYSISTFKLDPSDKVPSLLAYVISDF